MYRTIMASVVQRCISTLMTNPEKKLVFLTRINGIRIHWAHCDAVGKFVISTLMLTEYADLVAFEQVMLSIDFASETDVVVLGMFEGQAEICFDIFAQQLRILLNWSDNQLLEAKTYARACFFPYKNRRHAESIRIVPIFVNDVGSCR